MVVFLVVLAFVVVVVLGLAGVTFRVPGLVLDVCVYA